MKIAYVLAPIAAFTLLTACSSGEDAVSEEPAEETAEAQPAAPEPAVETPEANEAEPLAPAAEAAAEIDGIENRRVSFAAGSNSATVEDSITGYEGVDYLLNVREGQLLNISMATPHTATYFNVLEPGETDVATFIGSTSGKQFEGVAAASGDYRIRVYMMRSAARRDETAEYRLEMIVD